VESERITLSQRERDRLRVLHEIKRKQITQLEAARRLKISDRHIRRLLLRLEEYGDRAIWTSDPPWPPSTWPSFNGAARANDRPVIVDSISVGFAYL
jgi:hypothetical protein